MLPTLSRLLSRIKSWSAFHVSRLAPLLDRRTLHALSPTGLTWVDLVLPANQETTFWLWGAYVLRKASILRSKLPNKPRSTSSSPERSMSIPSIGATLIQKLRRG